MKTNDPSRPNVQANKNIQICPPRMRNSWGACMGMWRVTWARVSNGGDIVWIDNSLIRCVGIMLLVFPLRVSYHSSLAHPSILPHYWLYLHPSLIPNPKSLVLDRYKIRAPLELVVHTTNLNKKGLPRARMYGDLLEAGCSSLLSHIPNVPLAPRGLSSVPLVPLSDFKFLSFSSTFPLSVYL